MGNQKNCLDYAELAAKNNNNQNNIEQDVQNCMKLNAGPTYIDGGLHQMNKTGYWDYFCTRNNNFSNRSQKGALFVDELLPTWSQAVIIGSSTVVAVIRDGRSDHVRAVAP